MQNDALVTAAEGLYYVMLREETVGRAGRGISVLMELQHEKEKSRWSHLEQNALEMELLEQVVLTKPPRDNMGDCCELVT